jgi:AbiV family abortive infection protein
LAIENSERHYRCAIHLKEKGEFGLAVSHLVLSVEEAIKAYFLYLRGLGIPIRPKALNDFLMRHTPRHQVGSGLYLAFSIGKWISDTLQAGYEESKNKSDQEILKLRDRTYRKIFDNLKEAASNNSNGTELEHILSSTMKWWEDANEKKESGFYVDYLNGYWSSPNLIKEEDYQQSLEIAENILQITRTGFQLVESLSDVERARMVKTLKQRYRRILNTRRREETL